MPDDYSDPCAVLPKLREAYYKMLQGAHVQEIEFTSGNGTKRKTVFHKSNIDALLTEVRRLEGLCGATPGKPRRRVILAG